jgi:hypothetical protein
MPEGQKPPIHVTVGVNTCVPSMLSVAEEGVTATAWISGTMVTGMRELCAVAPFKVALTKRTTIPPVLPAVKSTG